MRRLTRRRFLEMGASAVVASASMSGQSRGGADPSEGKKTGGTDGPAKATLGPAPAGSSAERPKTRVAVMGLNGRGRGLLSTLLTFPDVEIAYLCDPSRSVFASPMRMIADAGRGVPQAIADFRRALDDPKTDVLVCAAPDHWHALAAILGCQAGKDVYVEKPVSHNVVEGRRMVQAARKYGRIVQAGTQRRSSEEIARAVDRIRDGRLGKVHFARAWSTGPRPSIGHDSVCSPPADLDFDLWAGPAVNPEYKKNLVPYHWHWRWLYGTGECGNNGIHGLDVARWGLGVESPRYVSCGGNKYFFDDDQETPDTQLATFDFDHATIEWEHRTWSRRGPEGQNFGIAFYGSEAALVIADDGWKIYKDRKVVEQRPGTSRSEWEQRHMRNFLDCRITRALPAAEIEIGHRSTSLCHLANIAWRTRSTLRFDGATETLADNPAASALLSRAYRKGFALPVIG